MDKDKGIGNFTHHCSNGSSMVDYILTSQSLLPEVESFTVLPPNELSDHSPLAMSLKLQPHKRLSRATCRNSQTHKGSGVYYRVDSVSLAKLISHMNSDSGEDMFSALMLRLQSLQNVNCMLIDIQKALYSCMKECGTEQKLRQHTNKFPCNKWYNDDCKILRQKIRTSRRQLENGMKSRDEFLLVKRRYTNLVRRKKRQFQKSEKFKTRKSNTKEFWKEIKSREEKRMDTLEKISDENWVKHFEKIVGTSAHNHRDYNQPRTDENSVCNLEITIEEIHRAIGQFEMKSGKTPGPDRIPDDILNTGNDKFARCLCVLFQKIVDTGQFPS